MTETWTIPCTEHIPDAEELDKLFQDLANNKIPTLQWKNPGRRPASPAEAEKPDPSTVQQTPTSSPRTTTASDSYDFFDESPSDVRIRKPVTPGPKGGSAKKKTANFESVLDSFKKRTPTPKDPPSTPTTPNTSSSS